ncbi:hypothetical protein [Alsobacter sp. KACC 23698]|uniref:hypothetical protein n=1 Tax=Alsobacter sp. KACC 23698 TaxID=3149229 RepID=UPI003877C846
MTHARLVHASLAHASLAHASLAHASLAGPVLQASEKLAQLVPVLVAGDRQQTQERRHRWKAAAHLKTPCSMKFNAWSMHPPPANAAGPSTGAAVVRSDAAVTRFRNSAPVSSRSEAPSSGNRARLGGTRRSSRLSPASGALAGASPGRRRAWTGERLRSPPPPATRRRRGACPRPLRGARRHGPCLLPSPGRHARRR